MKSFLEKSKRALVLLLTGAMIATSVPSTAFAATVADDDVIIEEATDAVAEDAVAEEEVVADEPSEAVEALGAEEPVEGESDSVEADDATIELPHELRVYSGTTNLRYTAETTAKDGTLLTDFTLRDVIDCTNLVYGVSIAPEANPITYTVKADYSSGDDQDYSALSWVITDSTTKTAGAYHDVSADLPEGIHVEFSGASAKLWGIPKATFANKMLYLIAEDTNSDLDKPTPYPVIIPLNTTVHQPTLTAMAADETDGGTPESKFANAVVFAKTGGSNAKAGYTVLAKDPTGTNLPDNIKPVEVTISANNSDEHPITVVPSITGDDAAFFEVSPASVILSQNVPAKITVVPKTGCTAKGDKNKDSQYNATLTLTTPAFDGGKNEAIKLQFTVASDLAFKATQNGAEIATAETTGAGDLGDFQVGKAIDEITLTVSGGKTPYTISPIDTTKLPKGFDEPVISNVNGTIKLTGTPKADDYVWDEVNGVNSKDASFAPVAKVTDYNGDINDGTGKTYTMNILPADVTFTDANDNAFAVTTFENFTGHKDYNAAGYKYAWFDTAANIAGGSSKTINIYNNSTEDITFQASIVQQGSPTAADGEYVNTENVGTKFALENRSVTIEGGKKGTLKVTCTTAGTESLLILGKGIQKTIISLTCTEETLGTISTAALNPATVDEPYSFTLEAASNVAGDWTIGTATGADSNGITNTASTLKNTYGLTLNSETGTLEGTPLLACASLPLQIKKGVTTKNLTLVINKAEKNTVTLVAGSSEVKEAGKFKLDDTTYDAEESTVGTITINNTSDIVDLGDLTVTITEVRPKTADNNKSENLGLVGTATPATMAKYFTLRTLDASGAEVVSGTTSTIDLPIKLKKSGSVSFDVVSAIPVATAATSELGIDTYYADVTVSGDNLTSRTFTTELTVNGGLVFTDVNRKIYKVGEAATVTETTEANRTYIASAKTSVAAPTALNAKTDQVTFEWEKAKDATLDIKESGLTLSETGIISGTPVKAGVYDIVIKATTGEGYAGTTPLSGSKTVQLTVIGSATLGLTIGNSGTAINENRVLVLDGAAVGDTLGKGVEIHVGVSDAAITKGLKIDVSEVDTRTAVQKATKPNIHEGSTNFIGVDKTTIASIDKDKSATFNVVPKSTAAAKDAIVKVTISGDEASTTYFYVEYIVNPKLEIAAPAEDALTTKVGNDFRLRLEATGADKNQAVTWAEVQNKATEVTTYIGGTIARGSYINTVTATTPVADADKDMAQAAGTGVGITGLGLYADAGAVLDGVNLDPSDRRAWIGASARNAGAPALHGTFTTTVKAYAAGGNINATSEVMDGGIAGGIARLIPDSSGNNITAAAYYASDGAAIGTGDGYIAQSAKTTFTLTVNTTDEFYVSNVASDSKGYNTNAVAAASAVKTEAEGGAAASAAQVGMKTATDGVYLSDGITYKKITGYTFKEQPISAAVAETITVTFKNDGGANIYRKVSLKKGTASDFQLTGDSQTAVSTTDSTLTVKPKAATIAKTGEFTDALVVSDAYGNMPSFEIPISLTVAAANYKTDIYQRGALNASTTLNKKKDTKVVNENTVLTDESGSQMTIDLGTFKKNDAIATVTNPTVFIENVGNTDLTGIKVVEVKDASGTPFGGTTSQLLHIDDDNANDNGVAEVTLSAVVNAYDNLWILPSNTKTAGEKKAYLKISYTADDSYVVPVTYTVYDTSLDNGVDITPATGTLDILKDASVTAAAVSADPTKAKLRYFAEEYDLDAAKAAGLVTIANSNTGDASKALYNVQATLTGAGASNFALAYSDKTALSQTSNPNDTLTIKSIGSGSSDTFNVVPKNNKLRNGNYTATLTISSPSIATPIPVTVNFNVLASDIYSVDVSETTGGTPHAVASADVVRLYNSLVKSEKFSGTAGLDTSTSDHVKVKVDSGNVIVDFTVGTGEEASPLTATPTSATIAKKTGAIASSGTTVTINNNDVVKINTNAAITAVAGTDYFTSLTFNIYSTVYFVASTPSSKIVEKKAAIDTADGAVVAHLNDGALLDSDTNYVDYVKVVMPNNTAIGGIMNGGTLPTVKLAGKGFDGWYDGVVNNELVSAASIIKQDIGGSAGPTGLTPNWHTHKYTTDPKNSDYATWDWKSDGNGGYTATLTLRCIETNCDDATTGTVVLTDATTGTPVEISHTDQTATCAVGAGVKWSAQVTYNGVKYTSNYNEQKGSAKGHTWTYAATWPLAVTKNDDGTYTYKPTAVVATCSNDPTHTYSYKTSEISGGNVTIVNKPTATIAGKGTATATVAEISTTWDTEKAVEFASAQYTLTKEDVVLDAVGHDYALEVVEYNIETKEVKYNIVDKNDDSGSPKVVVTEATATATDVTEKDGTYTFKVNVSLPDGTAKVFDAEYVDHVHNWVPTWTEWARKNETDKFSWDTALTLTCTVGTKPETRTPEVTVTRTPDGEQYIDYVATATFDGKTYTSETLTVNAVTGDPTSKHEHKWGAPSWSWSDKETAIATFTCSVGKETKDVIATITVAKGPNSKGNTQYKATVTGPDNQEYSDLKWFDASGNPTTGEGIGIELAETEYPYTGAAIKPVFTVVDYSADKVLAEGTDYSVKYTNNNPNPKKTSLPVTATITVTGKGNYAVKDATVTAEFTIFDPMKDEDVTDYAGKVKSVKVTSKDNFAYDGTAKYPQTLLIKTDGADITATFDGTDGYTLNEGAKDVMIVVTNNINKGSGVVAVTGADKVTKKATFKIAACDLSKLSSEQLSITAADAVYAVKGAKSEVEVTFGSETLVAGKDYTLSWKYSGKKNVGEKAGQVVVKGKGNFTKSAAAVDFNITPFDINKIDNIAVFAGTTPKKVKVTLYDGEGTVIPAKQYTVKVEKDGTDVTADSKTKLKAGDEIDVTVTAVAGANITGDETETGIKVANNLAKVKVTVPKTFTKTYTGEAIELDSEDFGSGKITVGTLEYGTDFEIVGYQNNIKKGTMTVFIQGISENASGMGKIKVKIDAKKMVKAE